MYIENFSYLESEILGKKRDGRKKIKEKIDKKGNYEPRSATGNVVLRTEKNKSKVITTGGSYGAAEGRRKQTKGRSKNKE